MKSKLLITALLLFTLNIFAQNVPSYVPTNGLVGWWPFNGNANDESGNGNNGVVYGATLTSDRLGNTNKSYSFSSVPNRIEIGNTLSPSTQIGSPNSSWSASAWINKNNSTGTLAISDYNSIAGNTNPGENDMTMAIHLQVYQNYANVGLRSNNVDYNVSGGQVSNSQWHHIAFTADNGILKLYFDGSIVGQTIYISSSNFYEAPFYRIGASMWNGNYGPSTGIIDEVGIWNRALTQQEITALYNAQTCNSSSNIITADGPTTFCAGNSVNLKSDVVGGTYQWKKNGVNVSSNGTSRTYKATATGSYTCVATCNGTALTSNAIQVTSKTNAAITVTTTGATSFCVGDSVTLNCTNLGSNYSVQWYRTNVSMENATNYTQVVKQPGTYKVVSKNLTTGCSRISSSSVVVAVNCRLANPDVIAVENDLNDESARTLREDMPETIRIYPNPNDGSFTFEFQTDTEGAGDLQIINMMGQSIYNANVTATNGFVQHQINLGDQFEKGLYIVRYTLNGKQYDRKLMLK
jgi:hypothetical protein